MGDDSGVLLLYIGHYLPSFAVRFKENTLCEMESICMQYRKVSLLYCVWPGGHFDVL